MEVANYGIEINFIDNTVKHGGPLSKENFGDCFMCDDIAVMINALEEQANKLREYARKHNLK